MELYFTDTKLSVSYLFHNKLNGQFAVCESTSKSRETRSSQERMMRCGIDSVDPFLVSGTFLTFVPMIKPQSVAMYSQFLTAIC